MKSKTSWIVVAALGAVALLAAVIERGKAQYFPPGMNQYQTGCAAIDAKTVEGFVTNNGPALLQVNGMVSFSFTVAGSMSHPTIQVPSVAFIPPAKTVSVARAGVLGTLLPNEVCQLDVSGAVR
jgi:hypothetical protein